MNLLIKNHKLVAKDLAKIMERLNSAPDLENLEELAAFRNALSN